MVMVRYPWPSQEIVEDLVWKSSGYFIYASTVVKFVDDKNFRPTERLKWSWESRSLVLHVEQLLELEPGDGPSHGCIQSHSFLRTTSSLVTMLRSFNPDFLFNQRKSDGDKIVNVILDWLKQSRPKPKDLIEVWEDYGFMIYCESGWNLETGIQAAEADWDSSHQALSQASPSLIPILQAVFLLRSPTDAVIPRWVTDAEFLDPTIFRPRFDSILSDLARSSLHPMQRVLTDEIDKRKVWGFEGFSFYLRSCSHSSKLLQDLRVAEPVLMTQGWWHPYDYYNIVQWLKAFPQPPLELISRFEGYYLDWANGSDLEGKWRDWKESVKRHLDMVERCGKRRNRTIVPGHPRKLVP
ncbi:hypothetical protein B0H14DRAFT_2577460 [Mycena olivaceomarginata]|nr:hypothetical protein B0H14DRAFT_2577460 [Mycena olivaceomarginata]